MLRTLLCCTLLASAVAQAANPTPAKTKPPTSDDSLDPALLFDEPPPPVAPRVAPAPAPAPTIVPPAPAPRPWTPPPAVLAPAPVPQTTSWYQPTEAESHAAWNRHDPWNDWGLSNRLSFFTGVHSFIVGGPTSGTTGSTSAQGEIGLAYSFGRGFGFRLSTIQPVGMWALSFTFMRNRGVRLYDFGDPDVALGYAMVAPEFGLASDFSGKHTFVTAGLSVGGVRGVVGDLLSADLRLTPMVWLAPSSSDSPLVSVSLGFTLDVGLVH